ncbi:MAG TPA: pseudouridylate synthase [Bacteroidetes bacterium]|nr:pseudouridylate synthase [Bacteroidota bacterium]
MNLEIVYQDDYFVAINKPAGLLVHRSAMAANASEFALQRLRNQLGKRVFPAHRLDRKTSGVLLFSLSEKSDLCAKKLFSERKTKKIYHAIVRGFAPLQTTIDYPLKNDKGKIRPALTRWKTLAYYELAVPFGPYPTSRYSLVEMIPHTGRFHQLRKHAAHIFHPIIGDRPHGCNKQNRLWKEKWGMTRMLLHASSLSFQHPFTGKAVRMEAAPDGAFAGVVERLARSVVDGLVKNPALPVIQPPA